MKKLPTSLVNKAKQYLSLDDRQKLQILKELYNTHNLSWSKIAELCQTYSNKVIRDATKLGIQSRSRSEAQSIAIEEGRHPHPTRNVGHSEKSKLKISQSVVDVWDNMTKKQRQEKKVEAKERWDKKSPEEVRAFREAASQGVRKAAKEGSELEKYLLRELIGAGHKVEFHKERWVISEKLQVDLFLPEINVAIEVDGPSHFENIWGQAALQKSQQRDNHKTGLLLQRGCVIIRVRQKQHLTVNFKHQIKTEVLQLLERIKKRKPSVGNRHIILGE